LGALSSVLSEIYGDSAWQNPVCTEETKEFRMSILRERAAHQIEIVRG
jgi:hypothetical protein